MTCFSRCVGPSPYNLCSITWKVHKCAIPNVCNKINSGIPKLCTLLFRNCNMWCDDPGMHARMHMRTCVHTHQVSCKMSFHLVYINTLPSGHAEMRDCYPVHCWQVTHFYVFLHNVLHMHLSAGLAHFSLQGYRQHDAGCLGLKLQIKGKVMTLYF